MRRILRLTALFMLLLLLPASALAQARAQGVPSATYLLNIRGTVFENQSLQPMEGAAVKLYNERDSMIAGATTKQNGQFLLPGIPSATYTLQVSFMGYKVQKFKLTLPKKSGNFKVADVMMREDATVMAEAVVEGKLPEMTVVDDTVAYNADAFKLPEGSMVEDLIKKLPGIVQDENGGFTFNGKTISQILVDGKEFFGNNRNMVLQNVPAEIVDKVKAYLRSRVSEDPYYWLGNREVLTKIKTMAKANYVETGYGKAKKVIDEMPADQVKEYLKKLIEDNIVVGVEIMKGQK